MVKKTTSTREGHNMRRHKGFGGVTGGWQDRRRALREFCRVMKKELYPILGLLFKIGLFASYKEDDILDVLVHNIVNAVTSENGTRSFGHEHRDYPSPRTIRCRLGKLEFSEVASVFQKINKKILFYVRKQNKFNIPVLLSIDITYIHFYGKRRKYACGMKRDRGTSYGYKYASVVVSVAGIRVTLHTVAMTEFTRTTEILEKLIKEARKYVKIKAVLIDREFSNEPCIRKLEELNVKYFTPVVKTQPTFLHSLRPPCKAQMPLGSIDVPIVAVRDPDHPEDILYYCTNMDIPSEHLEEVIKVYRKRWTIENAFKSQKLEFLGKTYSVDFAIRFFFWVLATLLYNVWVLCNLTACMDLGLNPFEQERPLITAFVFGSTMGVVFISPLFDSENLLQGALLEQYLRNLLERIVPA